VVVVRNAPSAPSDDEAVEMERAARAAAVAEISWIGGAHHFATLHVHLASSSRWIDREIRFTGADAPADEWRTIGFAVASMMPDEVASAPAVLPPPAPPPPTPATAPELVAPATEERHLERASTVRTWTGAVDIAAIGAAAVAGTGSGFGGSLAGRWYFTPHVGMRAAVALHAGEVESAESSSLFLETAMGVAWRAETHARPHAIDLGARTDLILGRQQLSHISAVDHVKESQARWVPGADLVVEGSWSLSEGAAVVAGAGAQAWLGKTDVFLRGQEVATVAPIAMLLEMGIRARF
jgi:hypothetical protein